MTAKNSTRLKRAKLFTALLLMLMGFSMLLVAFFAFQLHLDNNPEMGNQRKVLALMGIGSLLLAAALMASKWILGLGNSNSVQQFKKGTQQFMGKINKSPVLEWFRNQNKVIKKSRLCIWINRHPAFWTITGAISIIIISFWYITTGLWTWTASSLYFDRQADAFLNGSLALLEKPSEELLALADPYNYLNREDLEYIWDISFYQGKFYLYWGPVPAVIAVAIKLVHPQVIEDQYLLMFFITGIIIAVASLLHLLRKTFFPNTPAWTVLLLILVAGLNTPVMWLINQPRVYETAIAGGAFFLISGLYTALRGMTSKRPNRWLTITGLAWGASVGCRVNNIIAIFWLAGLLSLFFLTKEKKSLGWIKPLIFLGIPLFTWAVGLGWYNFARFGSVLETGHRYQLTGPSLPMDYSLVMSSQYIVLNLYNYLFRPLVISWQKFPYVFTPFITEQMWPWFMRLPKYYYYSEPVTGIFHIIPLFLLVALAIHQPLQALWDWINERPKTSTYPRYPSLVWLWWMITGATIFSLLFLSLFNASIMRYLGDVVPLMVILTGMCIWQSLDRLKHRTGYRRLLLVIVIILGSLSICIGLLGSFQVGFNRFELNNPYLYSVIKQFFTGK